MTTLQRDAARVEKSVLIDQRRVDIAELLARARRERFSQGARA
jgi:hypothetical protein